MATHAHVRGVNCTADMLQFEQNCKTLASDEELLAWTPAYFGGRESFKSIDCISLTLATRAIAEDR